MEKNLIDIEDCVSSSMLFAQKLIQAYHSIGWDIGDQQSVLLRTSREIGRFLIKNHFVVSNDPGERNTQIPFEDVKNSLFQEMEIFVNKMKHYKNFREEKKTEISNKIKYLDKVTEHILDNALKNLQVKITLRDALTENFLNPATIPTSLSNKVLDDTLDEEDYLDEEEILLDALEKIKSSDIFKRKPKF